MEQESRVLLRDAGYVKECYGNQDATVSLLFCCRDELSLCLLRRFA